MQVVTLMIQGTSSDAGKSALVTGLCRYYQRHGALIAPFKPQNMALNSAVTIDGGEIGRAQAVQAQACGLEAHTDMNPVLLKPNSDKTAQVIIQGKVFKNLGAKGFHAYKQQAMPKVLESYQRLSQQYDRLCVEGAGSPAEINLRDRDIANMGFAEAVDCPVILVADIERGGVFAQLIGTLELLSASERQRILGFVINRFRGDVDILQPGLDWLEKRTGKPVFGVLPYLHNLYLESEDSVAVTQLSAQTETFNIVVICYPRMSNHTDFDCLRLNTAINIQFCDDIQDVKQADLIILAGSKSVRDDLAWLYAQHWDALIARHLRYGGKVIGLCGGYQMLGHVINDPDGIEGTAGSSKGLELLDIETILVANKQLKRVSGYLCIGQEVHYAGYEIHAGISTGKGLLKPLLQDNQGDYEGCISDDNQIIGSYVHGLFDLPDACEALLKWAGADNFKAVDVADLAEQGIDLMADTVRDYLDMPLLEKHQKAFYASQKKVS